MGHWRVQGLLLLVQYVEADGASCEMGVCRVRDGIDALCMGEI